MCWLDPPEVPIGIDALIYGAWLVINLPGVPAPKFDPSFIGLAMVASVEAIFLTTFVLMTQNRMSEQADNRAELDLQISLLAEYEVTRLITLVKAIGEKLDVEASKDPELSELQQDVPPERMPGTHWSCAAQVAIAPAVVEAIPGRRRPERQLSYNDLTNGSLHNSSTNRCVMDLLRGWIELDAPDFQLP